MQQRIRVILFLLIIIWVFGIFIEFFIPLQNNLAYLFPFFEGIYSTVCHQQLEKLININGYQTLVCSRCAGIYLGGLLSSFILLFAFKINFKNGKLILAASIPMLVDVLLYSSGFYDYTKSIAFVTGLFFGFIGIAYIYNGLQILLVRNGKSE
ncbi:MAG: DUF2085 domain-containing protein [Melioribacteraceae bacterium]|nr:DUF2085 domain-containing protein [Melioribacteraceae bacterium]